MSSRPFSSSHLSWSDRFGLIEYYKPSDEAIMQAFNVSEDELKTARMLLEVGTFVSSKTVDAKSYSGIFEHNIAQPTTPIQKPAQTTHMKPESATRRTKATMPRKRGRKGDTIQQALLSAPTTPVPVSQFIQKHNISLAVLRQAKRFVEKMPADVQTKIGKICVKQDKNTKELCIWREGNK